MIKEREGKREKKQEKKTPPCVLITKLSQGGKRKESSTLNCLLSFYIKKIIVIILGFRDRLHTEFVANYGHFHTISKFRRHIRIFLASLSLEYQTNSHSLVFSLGVMKI